MLKKQIQKQHAKIAKAHVEAQGPQDGKDRKTVRAQRK